MLRVGDRVPDFELPMGSRDLAFPPGSQPVHVPRFRLSEILRGGEIVLSFFPLAFTPVCTRQACDVADLHHRARVFGFSANDPFTNSEFARAHRIPYPIVSDPNREVLPRIWDVQPVLGIERLAKRGVMVVGSDARVVSVWSTADPYQTVPVRDLFHGYVPRSRSVHRAFG